jgi:hypothetical protein
VQGAYPSLRTFDDQDGLWLLAQSTVLRGLGREATFLVANPYNTSFYPRSWAFWTAGGEHRWIGPRHTNFGDGSICAFSPDDGVWAPGDDLTLLLDLYSVWALRQLHLEVHGRWPGKQYSLGSDPQVQAYYRRIECRDDELCGCGSETLRYAQCCKARDVGYDFIALASHFLRSVKGGFQTRKPPDDVLAFIAGAGALPAMRKAHLELRLL